MQSYKHLVIAFVLALPLAGCGHDRPAYHDASYYMSHPKQEQKVAAYCKNEKHLVVSEERNCKAVALAEFSNFSTSQEKKPVLTSRGGTLNATSQFFQKGEEELFGKKKN